MIRNFAREYFLQACCTIALTTMGAALRASAQAPPVEATFEVATIKPVDPARRFDPKHHWVHVTPAGASYWYMTVDSLMTHAYDVEPFQVIGPDWANADHFDIEARFPEGADKKDEPEMLQALLKDRFRMIFHVERRELEGYVLEVGKNGSRLKPSPADPVTPGTSAPLNAPDGKVGEGPSKAKIISNKDGSTTADLGQRGTMTIKFDQESWTQRAEFSKMTMEEFAGRLSLCLGDGGHKVTDETGLKGTYQVAYDCPMPRPHRPGGTGTGTLPPDPDDGSALIRSLDALGLRLEKRKTLQDVYVIDHVERPSEN
jgi:uncharacterized protein (TIGR03435 family)